MQDSTVQSRRRSSGGHGRWAEEFCPELGAGRRTRLVILAGEVGGRWWTTHFLRVLAIMKGVPTFCKLASRLLGSGGRTSSGAFADSLLEVRGAGGTGGSVPPPHHVVRDNPF